MSKKKLVGIFAILIITVASIGYSAWLAFSTTNSHVTIDSNGSSVYLITGFDDVVVEGLDMGAAETEIKAVFGNQNGALNMKFEATKDITDIEDDCIDYENDTTEIEWDFNGDIINDGDQVLVNSGLENNLTGTFSTVRSACPQTLDIQVSLTEP